ncbi:hypothetical protein B0H13DRAFT_1852529 [Mycena leptocephala]|nr:hypothetical protein B0H13DRAFT_1852529 [Mycena leptocephala]
MAGGIELLRKGFAALEKHVTKRKAGDRLKKKQRVDDDDTIWLDGPLEVLTRRLWDQGRKQDDINAELRGRVAALEADNENLRADCFQQGRMLAALQTAVSRLEITSAAPLIPKRPRLDDPNGFIAFGPLNESAETPQKQFELHLRTAIPHFRLEAPYTVRPGSDYEDHLRVTVKSTSVARALIDAWANQTVAGYTKVRMVEMTAGCGKEGVAKYFRAVPNG